MKNILVTIIISLHLGACATISRGPNVEMVVDSQPAGAVVTTDLETKKSQKLRKSNPDAQPSFYGCAATPCEFEISRRSEFIMTITADGHEPIEIGVDNSLHRESLKANLAGAGGVGALTAAGVGAIGAGFASAGYITSGAALGTTAAAAATVAGGVGLVSIGVDAVSGAMLNLNPNPVFLVLPRKGKSFDPDPKVAIIRRNRMETYEERRTRKAEEKRLKKIKRNEEEKE